MRGEIAREQAAHGEVEYFCTACASTLETTFLCGPCGGVEKSPVITLNASSQIVRACPTCANPFGLALSKALAATGKAVGAEQNEAPRATAAIDGNDIIVRTLRGPRTADPAAAIVQPAPTAVIQRTQMLPGRIDKISTSAKFVATPEAGDIESSIRNRLAEIDAELAHRRSLEAEAKVLRKMLAVADRQKAQIAARARVAGLVVTSADATKN